MWNKISIAKTNRAINVKRHKKWKQTTFWLSNGDDHNEIELIALIRSGRIVYALSVFRFVSLI